MSICAPSDPVMWAHLRSIMQRIKTSAIELGYEDDYVSPLDEPGSPYSEEWPLPFTAWPTFLLGPGGVVLDSFLADGPESAAPWSPAGYLPTAAARGELVFISFEDDCWCKTMWRVVQKGGGYMLEAYDDSALNCCQTIPVLADGDVVGAHQVWLPPWFSVLGAPPGWHDEDKCRNANGGILYEADDDQVIVTAQRKLEGQLTLVIKGEHFEAILDEIKALAQMARMTRHQWRDLVSVRCDALNLPADDCIYVYGTSYGGTMVHKCRDPVRQQTLPGQWGHYGDSSAGKARPLDEDSARYSFEPQRVLRATSTMEQWLQDWVFSVQHIHPTHRAPPVEYPGPLEDTPGCVNMPLALCELPRPWETATCEAEECEDNLKVYCTTLKALDALTTSLPDLFCTKGEMENPWLTAVHVTTFGTPGYEVSLAHEGDPASLSRVLTMRLPPNNCGPANQLGVLLYLGCGQADATVEFVEGMGPIYNQDCEDSDLVISGDASKAEVLYAGPTQVQVVYEAHSPNTHAWMCGRYTERSSATPAMTPMSEITDSGYTTRLDQPTVPLYSALHDLSFTLDDLAGMSDGAFIKWRITLSPRNGYNPGF